MEKNMAKQRIAYKKYSIEDTVEFCKRTSDWKEYARPKHNAVFSDLLDGLTIQQVCEKYSITRGNIYDYSASLRHRYDNHITGKKKLTGECEKITKVRKYFDAVNEEEMFDILSNKEYEYSLLFKSGNTIKDIAEKKNVAYETVFSTIIGNGMRLGAANKIFKYLKIRDGENFNF